MTREQVEIRMENFKREKVNQYRMVKNKIVAGVEINIGRDLPYYMLLAKSNEVTLEEGESIEALTEHIEEAKRIEEEYKAMPYVISVVSTLGAEAEDDVVHSQYIWIAGRFLQEEGRIDFTENNREFRNIIIEESGKTAFYLNRTYDKAFMDGRVEFETLLDFYKNGTRIDL